MFQTIQSSMRRNRSILVVTSSECPSCKHSLKRIKRQLKTKSHDLSSIRGGFDSLTTSCKRHEMSSKKCVGRGGVERGPTYYLPEEGEVRVRANRASCNPSRLGLG